MKLIITRARPANDRERIFRLEIPIDDLKNPSYATMVLDGKEYQLEVKFE